MNKRTDGMEVKIPEMIEAICGDICDNYCKFSVPGVCQSEEDLDEVCKDCPLTLLT